MAETTTELEAFRTEARAWLEENFPKSLAGRAAALMGGETIAASEKDAAIWAKRLGAKGWATPTWPTEYGGGGLSQVQAQVLNQEIDRIGAFNPLIRTAGMGITMVGPTILEYGTEDQKQRHIPPICRGDVFWSLGYSEPNAGSDLASLAYQAEDAGDHWVVNGQKTWTSGADISQLVRRARAYRSDRPEARRHQFPDVRHASAGNRNPTDPPHRRRLALLRDVLQRRASREERPARAAERRLDRRQAPAAARTPEPDRRQPHGMGGGQRDRCRTSRERYVGSRTPGTACRCRPPLAPGRPPDGRQEPIRSPSRGSRPRPATTSR